MSIPRLVQVDGLEDVVLKVHLGWELCLVVRAVEAHLQFAEVLVVHLDVVHWLEVVARPVDAFALVDAT